VKRVILKEFKGRRMRILVAIEDANDARVKAKSLKEYFSPEKSELNLLHVSNALDFAGGPVVMSSYTNAVEQMAKEARVSMGPAVEDLRADGYKVEVEIAGGDTIETILSVAEKWKADLIVVGSRGGGQMRQFLLGSVAYAVVRKAPCSLLVLREAVN
jgi:nucleotide-binding universal stress UspA family protein